MTEQKFDYYSEALAFLKLKKSGKNLTQQGYCSRRAAETGFDVSYPYFKKVLGRVRREKGPRLRMAKNPPGPEPPLKSAQTFLTDPEWPAVKDAYLCGKFKSLTAVADHLGVRVDHRGFKAATRGWAEERRSLKPAIFNRTPEELTKTGAVQEARDLYADALAAHYKLMDLVTDSAINAGDRWKKKDDTQWHTQMTAQAAMDLAKAMAQLLPAIKGLENLRMIHQIFDELGDGKTDIVKASLDLARLGVALPKPIEILLARHRADETAPDDGELVTDAEIMRRRAELLAEIQTERVDFVPERKRMVTKLKAEIRDSFQPEKKER